MVMEIKLGDVYRLKKKHPCGGDQWQVVRLGADIGIKCLNCQRRVLLERAVFERRVKELVSRSADPDAEREREIEAELADLKARWPAHSVPPSMWMELERLEEELEKLRKPKPADSDAD